MKYHTFLLAVPLLIAGCTSQEDATNSTGETAATVPVVQATAAPTGSAVPDGPIENIALDPSLTPPAPEPAPSVADDDLKTALVGIWQYSDSTGTAVMRFFADGRQDSMMQVTSSNSAPNPSMIVRGTYRVVDAQSIESTQTSNNQGTEPPSTKLQETIRIQGDSLWQKTTGDKWMAFRRLPSK